MSSKYTLKLMPQAERDLDDIFEYINNELSNPPAAENTIDEIINALLDLENMPKKHPISSIPQLKALGVRKVIIKNYIGLYLIDDKRRFVIVITVFYGARDYNNINLLLT